MDAPVDNLSLNWVSCFFKMDRLPAIDLCKKMKQERKDELQEMEQLRNEIKALEADIRY